MFRTWVLLSGGLDSAACVEWSMNQSPLNATSAITFDYGQDNHELKSASVVADMFGIDHHMLRISSDSLCYIPPIRTGCEYDSKEHRTAFIPGRNILFLTLAAIYASKIDETQGSLRLCIGVTDSEEDGIVFPDCTSTFLRNMEHTLSVGMGRSVCIYRPLIEMKKADIVRWGSKHPRLWDVWAHTYSCYAPATATPCGECQACLLRKRGFEQAEMEDPGP